MAKAEVYRIVLAQNPATLWTDLGIQNERWIEKKAAEARQDGQDTEDESIPLGWTEQETVELESIILVSPFESHPESTLIYSSPASHDGSSVPLSLDSDESRIEYDAQSDDSTTAETQTILPHRGRRRGGWREREARTRGEREAHEDWRRGNQSSEGNSVRLSPLIPRNEELTVLCDRFARLAFIQAYRERSANPPSIAPPPAPAAATANSSVTSIRLTVNNPATGSRAVVAAPSTYEDTRKRNKKKKVSTGAATESDGTPGPPSTKRIKKATHAGSVEAADESFDRDRAAAERKRVAGQKKRAEAKASKGKKKKGDYTGGSSSKYSSWAS